MAIKVTRRKNVQIGRVVTKVVISLLALYVGGTIVTEIGEVITGTQSPFYPGLGLLGWTVGDLPMWNSSNYAAQCANTSAGGTTAPGIETCVTDVTGSGILAVIGIVAIASIVTEFVQVSM